MGKYMEGAAARSGANAKAADADFQAERAQRAAEFGRVQADQTDAQLREDLATTVANIDAIRASSNIDPRSPTGYAIKDRETYVSDRTRRNAVTSIRMQAAEDERMAQYGKSVAAYQRSVGDYALKMGKLGALATVAGGISKGIGAMG